MRLLKPLIVGLLIITGLPSVLGFAAPETDMQLNVEGKGRITILLYTSDAPKTCAHIIDLVKKHFYDGQRFYRVITTPRPYLVQIGAPGSRTKDMDDPELLREDTGAKIAYENSGHSNDGAGVVGLAAPEGERNGGDCQFYILLAPAKYLDGNYTVFGKVVGGMDVLKNIQKGDTISSATIVER